MDKLSNIAEFFEDKIIFITGGTGFMGKVLVEKLLSSCPGIKKIYVLARPKKGDDKQRRLDKIKNGLVFLKLKSLHPEQLDKLQALEGDIELPDLGLSEADKAVLLGVNIVFNMAATLNFNEDLRKSVVVNVLATKALLEICLHMKDLKSLVHVSTAYSNCGMDNIEERVYPAPIDLDQLVQQCRQCSDQDISDLTSRVLGNRPNTYVLTKALAENVVQKYAERLPIAIVRPSIVTAASASPFPGWVDSKSGSTGMMALIGSGIVRVLPGDTTIVFDIIPVDFVDNALIAVAWKTATLGISEPLVYNVVSGAANPLRLDDMLHYCLAQSKEIPQDTVMWYPSTCVTNNKLLYNIRKFWFHLVPAYLHDHLLMSQSSKKLSLMRVENSVQKASDALEYFLTNGFDFAYDNVPQLLSEMSQHDRNVFNINVEKIDWFSYIGVYMYGIRKYILHQKDEYLPEAKRRMHILSMKDKALKLGAAVLSYYLAVTWTTPYFLTLP